MKSNGNNVLDQNKMHKLEEEEDEIERIDRLVKERVQAGKAIRYYSARKMKMKLFVSFYSSVVRSGQHPPTKTSPRRKRNGRRGTFLFSI